MEVESVSEDPPPEDLDLDLDLDLESLTREQLHERRLAIQVEEERRQRLEDGEERIGQATRDYLDAARIECAYTPAELGHMVIEYITKNLEGTEAD
ncbi:hypothetical protein ACHABQ_02875 [Nesterenkonia aurantiaca]|uniref:hypothetical protein n=1 Tax=Nesterenkonia aurantiaca TaxID=1436010 RepID=UPI003EE47589